VKHIAAVQREAKKLSPLAVMQKACR